MKKINLIFVTVCLIFRTTYGHTNSSSVSREPFFLGSGTVVLAVGGIFYFRTQPLDSAKLRPEHVFPFDRLTLGLCVGGTARASDFSCIGSMALPIYAISRIQSAEKRRTACAMLLESHLFSQGVVFIAKGLFQRPRPYMYESSFPRGSRLHRDAFRSFFSGHTTAAFNNAILGSLLYDEFHPHTDRSKWIWTGGLTLAVSTGILRVVSGNHFPTDVVVGAVVGCFTGYLIHELHR